MISAAPSAASRLAGPGADGPSGLPLRWALPAALAGGLALAAAFPPAGIWPLAAVGPALLTMALAGRSGWSALRYVAPGRVSGTGRLRQRPVASGSGGGQS